MKGLESLKSELQKGSNELFTAEKFREQVIQDEINLLKEIIEYLKDVLQTETINNQKAYLIYIFEASEKRTISNKVFFCEDGKIRYQVYKKEEYLGYNPTANFEGSYAVVEATEMFKNIDLRDVITFFNERTLTLPKLAQRIKGDVEDRKTFLKAF